MELLKKDFIRYLEQIVPPNFKLISHEGVIWLELEEEGILKRISITFNEAFPFYVVFNSISASLKFEKIEKSMNRSSEFVDVHYASIDTIRFTGMDQDEKNSIMNKKIENELDFENLKSTIINSIGDTYLPLFDQFQDLYSVADLLAKLKPQEVVPYIQGAKLFVKTILIIKEASHPLYEQKRDEFYLVLKKQAEKKEVYAQQLTLFEYLFFEKADA